MRLSERSFPARSAQIRHFEHKHLGRRELASCYEDLLGRGYRLALSGPDTIGYRSDDE